MKTEEILKHIERQRTLLDLIKVYVEKDNLDMVLYHLGALRANQDFLEGSILYTERKP